MSYSHSAARPTVGTLLVVAALVRMASAARADEASAVGVPIEQLGNERESIYRHAVGELPDAGGSAVGPLIQALRHGDRDVRGHAAFVPGGVGEPAEEAMRALAEALSDKDEWVRVDAACDLGRSARNRRRRYLGWRGHSGIEIAGSVARPPSP